jgi:hypothetical protein
MKTKKALKKLRKHCEALSYQVQALELQSRLAELQDQATQGKESMGFCVREKKDDEGKGSSEGNV